MKTDVRLGIVGCSEGTHGKVWAELLSKPEGKKFGMHPVRIWDADSKIAETVAKAVGATFVHNFREAGEDVDGILITELFPDRYLELGRPFLEDGKRVFFNRPFAGSMADAREIVRLARSHGAKIYSASALFNTVAARKAQQQLSEIAPVRLFSMTGPSDHIYFYLPHVIASMVSVLGTGIAKVQSLSLNWRLGDAPHRATTPVVVYVEYGPDSRVGPARGVVQMIGPASKWYGFQLKIFGADVEGEEIRFEVSYDLLLERMAEFFRTGVEPVPHNVILEKTAVFYAALQSARKGGCTVHVVDMIDGSDDI